MTLNRRIIFALALATMPAACAERSVDTGPPAMAPAQSKEAIELGFCAVPGETLSYECRIVIENRQVIGDSDAFTIVRHRVLADVEALDPGEGATARALLVFRRVETEVESPRGANVFGPDGSERSKRSRFGRLVNSLNGAELEIGIAESGAFFVSGPALELAPETPPGSLDEIIAAHFTNPIRVQSAWESLLRPGDSPPSPPTSAVVGESWFHESLEPIPSMSGFLRTLVRRTLVRVEEDIAVIARAGEHIWESEGEGEARLEVAGETLEGTTLWDIRGGVLLSDERSERVELRSTRAEEDIRRIRGTAVSIRLTPSTAPGASEF